MATNVKYSTYKVFNGTEWDTYYYRTAASQVGESSTLVFLRPAVNTVNGKSFTTTSGITLYASDITLSSTDSTNLATAISSINTSIENAHAHENKDVLDGITSALIVKWDTASTEAKGATQGVSQLITGTLIAGKAKSDENGNVIIDTYATQATVTEITESVGSANGIAPLDENGKLSTAYIPDSVLGQLSYQGVWHADLTEATTTTQKKGDYYICTVAGSYTPSGDEYGSEFNIGDWAVYNGESWDKVDNTDAVPSVAGLTGAISVSSLVSKLKGTTSTKLAAGNHTHSALHTHDNNDVLDGITQSNVTGWNEATTNMAGILDGSITVIKAAAASLDGEGNVIHNTYATKTELESIHKIFLGSKTPSSAKVGDVWLEYEKSPVPY